MEGSEGLDMAAVLAVSKESLEEADLGESS